MSLSQELQQRKTAMLLGNLEKLQCPAHRKIPRVARAVFQILATDRATGGESRVDFPTSRKPEAEVCPSIFMSRLRATSSACDTLLGLTCSAVTAREQILCACLERLGTGYEEPEGISEPIDCVESETDGERVLDLFARDASSEQNMYVVRIHYVRTRQLTQHAQRCPQRLGNVRGVEIGEDCRDLSSILIRLRRDRGVRFRSKVTLVQFRDKSSH
jgi:hypothetical protein